MNGLIGFSVINEKDKVNNERIVDFETGLLMYRLLGKEETILRHT